MNEIVLGLLRWRNAVNIPKVGRSEARADLHN
jgi:hypothetical protein